MCIIRIPKSIHVVGGSKPPTSLGIHLLMIRAIGGANMFTDILTNLARGPQGIALLNLMETHKIDSGWTAPELITAVVTGCALANTQGNQIILDDGAVNEQFLLHLQTKDSRNKRESCTLNLAAVLAMAAAYCKYQQRLAKEASESIKARQHRQRRAGQKDVQVRRKSRNKVRDR